MITSHGKHHDNVDFDLLRDQERDRQDFLAEQARDRAIEDGSIHYD